MIEMDVALSAAEVHLVLALLAGVAWLLTAIRIMRGSLLGERGEIAVGICIAAALVALITGSLFLLGIIGPTEWFGIGVMLRLVVLASGVVALVDQRLVAHIDDEYAQLAAALKSERAASYAHLAAAIAENTRLTQRASDAANRADAVAAAVRADLSDQANTIIAQGVAAADALTDPKS